VHPTRPVGPALETLRDWAADHDLELVQVPPLESQPHVAPRGEVEACDLVVALGGDGTVLTALHAAALTHTPVLGVAYGSLGALSAVPATELVAGLTRYAAGDWQPRRLPALAVAAGDDGLARAINDVVLLRGGPTQLIVEVSVGADLYARIAGDGIIVATAAGSSAYSMAAGGPLLVLDTGAYVCTPLAMHGGCAPPLVVPADCEVTLVVDPGFGGLDLEADGHAVKTTSTHLVIRHQADYTTLVELGEPDSSLPALRRRGLVADSPRVLARDRRGT
jgi:NAD+ kinase